MKRKTFEKLLNLHKKATHNILLASVSLSLAVIPLSSCTKTIVKTANEKTIESFDHISIVNALNDVIQMDIDTYHAYMNVDSVIKKKKFRDQLASFRADHERHVSELSKAVLDLGGHPPAFTRDFKGFLTSGYTAINNSFGVSKAFEALETNEIISNKYYSKALTLNMPKEVKELIKKNLEDEKRHLAEIQKMRKQFKAKTKK